tara:strand:+ start:4120 stop:4755 length:636 start_codon:yes stop_codon:yes gene_type:complete
MKHILLFPFVLFLGVSCVGVESNYRDAKVSLDRGDYMMAFEKYTKASESGHVEAQYTLGRMYSLGWGVEQNQQRAAHWWRQAAEAGHANAQYTLGQIYFFAKDVPQDYVRAAHWWRQAAEEGHVEAQYNLGEMYEYGWGVPQSAVQAYKWFSVSEANASNKEIKNRAGNDRDDVAQMMSVEQVLEAERLVKERESINLYILSPIRSFFSNR